MQGGRKDPYKVLGVAKDASAEAVKKAYRDLAKKHHPDGNPGDGGAEGRFKEVSEAYEILKDPKRRAAHDAASSGASPFSDSGFGGFENAGGFSDIFDTIFSGFAAAHRPAGGEDIEAALELSLEDIASGGERDIMAPSFTSCRRCGGHGTADGSDPACLSCGGTGMVRGKGGLGAAGCPICHGFGRRHAPSCPSCGGLGSVQGTSPARIFVPKGAEEGSVLAVAGRGMPGKGRRNGDLRVVLKAAPHPLYRREGADLVCEATIPMTTAALGGGVELPSLDGGSLRVSIPAGTQSGSKLRIGGKGMPKRSGGRGDILVRVHAEIPTKMTARQRKLLEDYAQESGDEHSPAARGFLDRLSSLLKR